MTPGERRMILSSLGPLVRLTSHPKHGKRAGEIIKASVEAFPGYKAADTPIRSYFLQQKTMMEMPGQGDASVASVVNAMDTMGHAGQERFEDVLDSLGIKAKQKACLRPRSRRRVTLTTLLPKYFRCLRLRRGRG